MRLWMEDLTEFPECMAVSRAETIHRECRREAANESFVNRDIAKGKYKSYLIELVVMRKDGEHIDSRGNVGSAFEKSASRSCCYELWNAHTLQSCHYVSRSRTSFHHLK